MFGSSQSTISKNKEALSELLDDNGSQPSIRDVQPDASTPLVDMKSAKEKAFAPLQSLRKEWKQLVGRKRILLCLSPLLFLTGYELAFVSGGFHCSLQNRRIRLHQ